MAIDSYSTTAGSNTAINTINIATGMPPSNVNKAIREIMADMANWRTGGVTPLFTAGGTFAGAYTFSGAVTFSSTVSFSTALPVASGGTGAASITANRLVRGNGTGAFTASLIHDSGTAIGIGTTSPAESLDVVGSVKATSLRTDDSHLVYSASATAIGLRVGAAGPFYNIGTTGSSNMVINSSSGGDLALAIAGNARLTLTSAGSMTSAALADAPGYKGLPQRAITASTSLALSDMGLHIYISGTTSGQTVTIPANASVAFPIGSVVRVINDSNQNWSLAITTDTLLWSPSSGTGTRTIAAGGAATIEKVSATRWWVSGAGLT